MYSTVDEVYKKAGKRNPHDVTNEDYIDAIESADTIIRNSTQHDWQPTDPSFPLARKISKMLAASFIMDQFGDPKEEGETMFEKAMMLLQLLVTEDEGAADVNVTTSDYKTWPLNPNAKISRGRLSLNPIGHTSIDPDEFYESEL